MMRFWTSLFCFYGVLALTVSLKAEPDYQRVITLHNQIVKDKAGTSLEALNKKINELLGGNGNGISETPATPVQAANMVHVLIREALTSNITPEDFAQDVLKAYRTGKVRDVKALDHLKTVLIIYIAARLDKKFSEDQRTRQTYEILVQILNQHQLKIPSSEDIVKGELNRAGFFRLYNFFVKYPGAVKVMDVPLKPDETLDYEGISRSSPPSSNPSTPTTLSPSPSSSHTPTAPPLQGAPTAPPMAPPLNPPSMHPQVSEGSNSLPTPP